MKLVAMVFLSLAILGFPGLLWSGGVLVWNHNDLSFTDPESLLQVDPSVSIAATLHNNGVWRVDVTDTLPGDLSFYDAVFVLLGSYPLDGGLTVAQQDILTGYVNSGRSLYIEGGDFGNDYSSTNLFQMTGATFSNDGRIYTDGNVDVLEGTSGGDFADFSFVYYAYMTELPDNYVDEISAPTDIVAFISQKAGVVSNMRCVLKQDIGTNGGKIYYSTVIFGSLKDGEGSNTKDALMGKIVSLLNIGVGIQPTSLGYIKSLYR
jgi:hypothetical protein